MHLLVTSRLFHKDSTRFGNNFQETTVSYRLRSTLFLGLINDNLLLVPPQSVMVILSSIGLTLVTPDTHRKTFETLQGKTEGSQGRSPWLLIFTFFCYKDFFTIIIPNIRNKYSIILETTLAAVFPPPVRGNTASNTTSHQNMSGSWPYSVNMEVLGVCRNQLETEPQSDFNRFNLNQN